MAESEEEIKSLLMKGEEESEKIGLKHNIQKTKIMASGPITSWQKMGKQWKQCQTLFFWAPKSLQMVIAAMKLKDTCSLEGPLQCSCLENPRDGRAWWAAVYGVIQSQTRLKQLSSSSSSSSLEGKL